MTPIPHRYFEKLRGVIGEFEQWLASTEPAEDGSVKLEDLQLALRRATSIYTKALELYRIGSNPPEDSLPEEVNDQTSETPKISRSQ